jgi:hypothetical protein
MRKVQFMILTAFVALSVMGMAAIAWATPPTPQEVVSGAASDLYDSISAVLVDALPYVVLLAGLFIGIRVVFRLIRGNSR